MQQPFAIALDTVRGLGMAVTPENLLTPRKSVTAILGVADHPVTGGPRRVRALPAARKVRIQKEGNHL